jgi:hypothetical protein
MTTKNEELMDVLCNNCHGVFSISDKAIDIYNMRKGVNSNHNPIQSGFYLSRHDPVLLQIYHELGKDFNYKDYSNIITVKIPKKYKNCYKISEYDGLEQVIIDENEYKINVINYILMNDKISSFEKLNEIDNLIN